MTAKVAVDVYSWVAAAANHHSIPIEGIYRHAAALSRLFTPVVYLLPNEVAKYQEMQRGVRALEAYIQKPIIVYTTSRAVIADGYQVWLSIALDSPSPILPELKQKIYRVAVLHDTMAYHGVFGASNERTYRLGTEHNDMLLPVSQYAKECYLALERLCLPTIHNFMEYGCFHSLCALPPVLLKKQQTVSVSSVYPRKRVVATVNFAKNLYTGQHHHVGRFIQSEDPDQYATMKARGDFVEHGYCTDEQMAEIVATSYAYINMSEDEGFSMPPLEAILYGVPYLFLSPIAAHREFYSGVANFYEPCGTPPPYDQCVRIPEQVRRAYYNRWCFSRVIKPFCNFISG